MSDESISFLELGWKRLQNDILDEISDDLKW